jgi:hypothetical protein
VSMQAQASLWLQTIAAFEKEDLAADYVIA